MKKKKRNVVLLCFAILLFAVYCGLAINGVKTFKGIFTNTKALENTYYLVQIVCGIAVVTGALIAV